MPARIFLSIAILLSSIPLLRAEEPVTVARELYASLAGGDLDAVHARLAEGVTVPRLLVWKTIHRSRCVSLAALRIDDAHVDGDHATVRMTAAFAKLEPAAGRTAVDVEHPIIGMKRVEDRWLVDSWTWEEEKLVDELLGAASDAERAALVAAHPDLYDEALNRALRVRGTNLVNRQELDHAARIAASLHALVAMSGDDEFLVTADNLEAMMARREVPPDADVAMRFSAEALAAAQRTGNPDSIGLSLYNHAQSHQWHDGNTSKGAPLLEEALAMRRRYVDESIAQRAASLLTMYYLERGDFRRCFTYIAVSREIATSTNDTIGLYMVEALLANVFSAENDSALALPHYERARALADQAHFIGYIAMQRGYAHSAMLLGLEKEFHAAVEDLLQRQDQHDYSSLSELWTDVAYEALRRGALAEADHAANEAVRLADEALEDSTKADANDALAHVRFAQKKYGEALTAAERAIAYLTKRGTVGQLGTWVLAAQAHLALGDRDAAYASLRTAARYGEIERASSGGSERQAALLFAPAAEAYSMLVDLLVEDGKTRDALLVAESAKARTLLDILDGTRTNAEADAPPAMIAEERKREQELVEANAKGDRAAIEKARLELETYRSLVDANNPRLHATRGAGTLQSIESLEPLFPDDRTALVEYVAGEERLHIFVVRRARVDVRTVPIGRAKLQRLVTRYANALSSHDVAYAADARRLHELLLAPVLRVAPRARDLCIVPDGVLWRLPFESLIGTDGMFAIEKRAFFYAPSAVVLLRERTATARPDDAAPLFVGFGDPRLDIASGDIDPGERATSTSPIPEAAREVETIARIVGAKSSSVYTGADALESRAKLEAPRFRIVHLATHGVLDDANPMYSRLLLSRRDGDGEDGVLEAREMLDFHLRADLVVLSACDTARGDVHPGEGLIGMSWALFAAGAPSVIASQWRVGSARTETLMTTFYDRWMKQPRQPFAKARALRAARLALLADRQYRHPYYWSPFVLIGSAD